MKQVSSVRRFAFLFLSAVLFFNAAVFADPQDATLLQILARPRDFDRQLIRVVGYLHLERDGDAVYLHGDDFKHGVFGNGLALEITDDIFNRREQLTGKYVVIEGYFDAQDRGSFEVYSGTIKRIWRCDVWSTEEMPANRENLRKTFTPDTPKY